MQLVGFDTETGLLAAALKAPPLVCYSTSIPAMPLERWDSKAKLFRLWQDAAEGRVVLIGHNMAYDASVICAQYPDIIPIVFEAYSVGGVHDTMLREMLLQLESTGIPRRVSLADLARKYVVEDLDKGEDSWRLRYAELRNTLIKDWPERARSYAIRDATILIPIWHAQEAKAKHTDTFYNIPARCRLSFAMQLMTSWGLRTDPAMVEEMIGQFRGAQKESVTVLQEAGIMRDNESFDTKAVVTLIEGLMGEPLPRTDKSNPRLQKDHLATLGIPIVDKYLEYKLDGKMINTYLSKYRSGLIQCGVNPILANGRASLFGPSLQNLPSKGPNKSIREIFIPREGRVFCSIDYDGVELRTFAQHCLDTFGFSKLADIYRADPGADVPSMEGAALAGISVEDALARRAAGDPTFKPYRNGAKAALYGFHGGMGEARFISAQRMHGVHFTAEQAATLKRDHFEWLPELKPFFQHIRNDHAWYKSYTKDGKPVKRTEVRTTLSRRHRGAVGWCQTANSKFSEPMADGAGEAMFALVRAMYSEENNVLYGTRLVCYIHDEGLLELDKDGAHEQAKKASEIMCEEMRKFTPDIPITAGPALMSRWFKEAEGVYKDGRLQVWK